MKNILVFCLTFLLLKPVYSKEITPSNSPTIVRVIVNGSITSLMVSYIRNALLYAEKINATALLLQVNAEGGLVLETKDVVQDLLSAKIPTIAYVYPDYSQVTGIANFILMASDISAMATDTSMKLSSSGIFKDNLILSKFKMLAQESKKNLAAIDYLISSNEEISEHYALEQNLIDYTAKDIDELLTKIDGKQIDMHGVLITLNSKNFILQDYNMSYKELLLNKIYNKNLLYVIMLLGFLGIFIEFLFTGLYLPVIFGMLCLFFIFGAQFLPLKKSGILICITSLTLFVCGIYINRFWSFLSLGALILFFGSQRLFAVAGADFTLENSVILSAITILCLFMIFFRNLSFFRNIFTKYNFKKGEIP
jgi:membrane-bound serine protease (ClpP class)